MGSGVGQGASISLLRWSNDMGGKKNGAANPSFARIYIYMNHHVTRRTQAHTTVDRPGPNSDCLLFTFSDFEGHPRRLCCRPSKRTFTKFVLPTSVDFVLPQALHCAYDLARTQNDFSSDGRHSAV